MTIYARVAALLLLSITTLSACSESEDIAVPEVAKTLWAEFAADTVAEYYRRNPEDAVDAGLHQYDGQIINLSPDSVAEYLSWVRKTRSEAETYDDLDGMESFERDYLVASMNEEEFNFGTADHWPRNPAAYVGRLGFSVYLDREYAPLDVRMRGYTDYAAQIPAYFETMRSNLQPPLASPLIEMSLARFGGLVGYLETTVPEIFSSVENDALQAEFASANAAAVDAVRQTVEWLEELRETAHDDFALGEGRFLLDVTARYRNYPQEDFFGVGPDSQVEDRTNYRLEDTDIVGTAAVRAGDWLAVGFRGGFLATHTGEGTDSRFPSIETAFDDTRAPALEVQPNYIYGGPYLEIDYRDSKLNPRAGGYYRFEWTSFNDRNLEMFGFNRFEGEIRQYFPFFNRRRVFAFRAKTSMVGSQDGNRIPFYLRPTLGGSEDLRGFREFRFQDQNLMLMNLEYRYEAFSGLDMAIFGDTGKVFPRRADFDFTDLEVAWGIGARFNSVAGTFFRIDVAFSNEGNRIFYKFGHSF